MPHSVVDVDSSKRSQRLRTTSPRYWCGKLRCQSSLSLDRGKRKKKHSTFYSILERDRREGDREVEYSAGRHLHSRTASQLTCKYWKPFVAMSCNPDTCTFIYPSLLRSTETFSREEQPRSDVRSFHQGTWRCTTFS